MLYFQVVSEQCGRVKPWLYEDCSEMRPAILFLDTNILLDCPRPEDYRLSGRPLTLVVIPEVMRELRGLARSPGRGQAGNAMLALAAMEGLAKRRGSAAGVAVGRSGTTVRVLLGSPSDTISADQQLVLRAAAEQARRPEAMVAVVTEDWGVAELARAQQVKSILLRGGSPTAELEREVAKHDTTLDMGP